MEAIGSCLYLGKTVNQKPYHIPGGIAEISATITELKDAGVAIPKCLPFTSPCLACAEKTDGSWRVTVDYHQFNPRVTPVAAAVPDVVSFLEQINTSSTWHAAIGFCKGLFVCHKKYKCSQRVSAGKAPTYTAV